MREWLANRIAELGKKKSELARHLGIPASRISEMIAGKREIQSDEIAPLASFLNWTIEQLMRTESGFSTTSTGKIADISSPMADIAPPNFGSKDVPVRGVAAAGNRGGFQMSQDIIDYAPRPPAVANSKNIYAIFVLNDSMHPAYESGALVYVSPDKPARAGDYVIVQVRTPDGDIEALFKRLKRQDDRFLVLTQYNPPKDIKIAQTDVVAVHRAYTLNELVGV
jgi:phage repressor protein C with HTH and peptisase S24 domain